MKKLLKPLFFVGLLLLGACSGRKGLDLNIGQATQIDAATEKGDAEFTDLIEDIRFIPLETSDDTPLIGVIEKITYSDSCYYLLADRENSAGVFRYDAQGKFLNRIGTKGRGPAEYIDPADFVITSSGVIVLDHHGRKLVFYGYDGQYDHEVPLDYIIYEITGMADERLLFAVAGDNRHREEAKDYETFIIDTDGQFVAGGIYNPYTMNYSNGYGSFLYDGKVRYSKALRPMIYGITPDSVSVDYYIKMADSPLPLNYEEECRGDFERFMNRYRGRYTYFSGLFLENDRTIFFTTLDKNRQIYWNIYDKASQRISTGSNPTLGAGRRSTPGDWIIIFGKQNYMGTSGEDVIGYMNAGDIALENPPAGYEVLATFQPNDNPVIFRFKFKEAPSIE